jgi:putative NADH-flavin reductase
MHLTILGGSGGCGRQLLEQAIARGHQVTTVIRKSSKLDMAGVDVRRGELDDVALLREAVRGSDAVLSGLGLRLPGLAPWAKPEQADFLDRSTTAIISAMQAEGVKRLLAISAGGVGDSRAQMPGVFKAMISMTALRHVYPALERMENQMLQSGLDVCICRPTGLTDEPATGKTLIATRLTGRATIPRADVAMWMLDQLAQPTFRERTPIITVTGAG